MQVGEPGLPLRLSQGSALSASISSASVRVSPFLVLMLSSKSDFVVPDRWGGRKRKDLPPGESKNFNEFYEC